MWQIAGFNCQSRLMLGTAQYPSLSILTKAIAAAKTEIITVSLQRQHPNERGGETFWQLLQKLPCRLLPNTAGCHTAKQAIEIAQIAREIFNTSWIKLEVIHDESMLNPNPRELLLAAEKLIQLGFEIFPYCTDDLWLCENLVSVGCKILMPAAAPIGSGKGILNPYQLKVIRSRFPDIQLILDAGLGSPMHALQAMLLGVDGILINTAIAKAIYPIKMAKAFRMAVKAGWLAKHAGIIPELEAASFSTPLTQTLFWKLPC